MTVMNQHEVECSLVEKEIFKLLHIQFPVIYCSFQGERVIDIFSDSISESQNTLAYAVVSRLDYRIDS